MKKLALAVATVVSTMLLVVGPAASADARGCTTVVKKHHTVVKCPSASKPLPVRTPSPWPGTRAIDWD